MIARLFAGACTLALVHASPVQAEEKKGDAPWTLQEAIGNPDNFKLSANVRLRYEALHNQFRPGFDRDDDLIEAQTSIAAEWDTGPIRIGAEMVDSRAWDSDAGSSVGTSEVNTLELLQAYVSADFGDALGTGSDLRLDAGRFVLDLGSRRLLARSNFANSPNGFAGAKLELRTKAKDQLTLFYTQPSQKLPRDKDRILDNDTQWDRNGEDLVFWGGFFAKPKVIGTGAAEAYFFGLEEDDTSARATRDRHLFTPGARLYRDPAAGKFDYEFEYAYQFGTISEGSSATARTIPVSAHYLHAEAGYQFAGDWKPRISLEYDLATGDDGRRSYGRFDGLYGSRRADYGPSGMFGPLGRSNLSSPGVRLEVTPSKRWDAMAFWRLAWLDSATDTFASTGVSDPTGQSGRFGGHQIEARVRYWVIPKAIRVELGGAALLRGSFLRNAPAATDWGNSVYGFGDISFTF